MLAKLTTTINKIKTVPNPTNAEIIDQFYHYMKAPFIPLRASSSEIST